jgi:putative ABC transport system substrate-binding protein
MRRREFIAGFGGAVAWPFAARAQRAALPVIGYLGTGTAGSTGIDLDGFRQGLADAGFVDGRNLTIKYRWAEGRDDRLPALAVEFITQQVAVMVVTSNSGALTAKAARSSIPIVFSMGGDPVRLGLVDSLNRPGGNLTGIAVLSDILIKKRLQLLNELIPNAPFIAILLNPSNPETETRRRDVQAAAQATFQSEETIFSTYHNAGVRVFDIKNQFQPREIAYWVPPVPTRLIDPRPNVTKCAMTCDALVMPDGLMYVSDWNAGLHVLQYEG